MNYIIIIYYEPIKPYKLRKCNSRMKHIIRITLRKADRACVICLILQGHNVPVLCIKILNVILKMNYFVQIGTE